jgi:hypothetical protein
MTEHILGLLVAERSRLQAAIDALGGEESNMPEWVLGKNAPQTTASTPAQKSRSEQMKENWRKRKAAQAAAVAESVAPRKTNSVKSAEAIAPKKRTMSAASRKKMAEGQKKRWADIREMGNEAGHGKKKSAKAAIAEAIAPPEDAEFKSKMSIAMAKSWAKRKAAAKTKTGK